MIRLLTVVAALLPWAFALADQPAFTPGDPDPDPGVASCDTRCHMRYDVILIATGTCFHYMQPACTHCPGANAGATYYCQRDGTSSSWGCYSNPSGGTNTVYQYTGCTALCSTGTARAVEANPGDYEEVNPVAPPLNTCRVPPTDLPGDE